MNRLGLALCLLAALLSSCHEQGNPIANPIANTIAKEQAIQIAWETLGPYTSSHNLSNWQTIETSTVRGDSLPEVFQKPLNLYCFGGKTPVAEDIRPNATYWYILMEPLPATQPPEITPLSPTAPPRIPEPFVRQAYLLIDASDGRVAALRLNCVVY
ncbi:MAG: hypothetical protein AB1894_19340 [Chloroflexota bacterium]